jgi:hypothetical protein
MPDIDPEIKALQDAIFLKKVAEARRMTPGERMAAGFRLFDEARTIALTEIRGLNPLWTDEEVESEFRRRLAIERELSDRGIYVPCGTIDDEL